MLRIELCEPASDRDVRTDDQHDVRVRRVRMTMDLVEDAPGGEHAHDRGLAAARRHLARVPLKSLDAVGSLGVARLVERHIDPLKEIATRLVQKNDRLDGFELREEQALLAAVAAPVLQQLQRSASHAGPALGAPV